MSFIEILIIYLAVGAPFGVYFYVQKRHSAKNALFFAELAANFLFWIQYAARLCVRHPALRNFFDSLFGRKVVSDSARLLKIAAIRSSLETAFLRADPNFRVFEFRELLDRFSGLAEELTDASERPADSICELLEISGRPGRESSARCLQRLRIARLRFHYARSRKQLIDEVLNAPNGTDQMHADLDLLISLFEQRQPTLSVFPAESGSGSVASGESALRPEQLRAA